MTNTFCPSSRARGVTAALALPLSRRLCSPGVFVEGAYFYDEADAPGQDQLFGAMMRQILSWPKQSKASCLE
jgi:hypothetical protein